MQVEKPLDLFPKLRIFPTGRIQEGEPLRLRYSKAPLEEPKRSFGAISRHENILLSVASQLAENRSRHTIAWRRSWPDDSARRSLTG